MKIINLPKTFKMIVNGVWKNFTLRVKDKKVYYISDDGWKYLNSSDLVSISERIDLNLKKGYITP